MSTAFLKSKLKSNCTAEKNLIISANPAYSAVNVQPSATLRKPWDTGLNPSELENAYDILRAIIIPVGWQIEKTLQMKIEIIYCAV